MSGIRRMLNEVALTELENVRFTLPERKTQRRKKKTKESTEETTATDASITEKTEEPREVEPSGISTVPE